MLIKITLSILMLAPLKCTEIVSYLAKRLVGHDAVCMLRSSTSYNALHAFTLTKEKMLHVYVYLLCCRLHTFRAKIYVRSLLILLFWRVDELSKSARNLLRF